MPKVFLIHPSVHDLPSMRSFLRLHAGSPELEWSDNNPDILIASEWIFYRKSLFRRFRDLYSHSGVKVGYMKEALEPDFNVFDYGIGFSDSSRMDGRFIRLPSPLDLFDGFIDTRENAIRSEDQALEELSHKRGFCSFLYSNANANPMRDKLFHALDEYRRVDSLGRHLNNVGVPGTGFAGHRSECKVLKSDYKFGISAENTDFKGGTTEKIFTTLAAHSVPVYWGNPSIADDVNPDCFINAADYPDLTSLVERVKEVDHDDVLWAKMVSAPWFTPEQVKAHADRTARYLDGMGRILSGEGGLRAPEGYHAYLYRRWFLDGKYPFDKPNFPFLG